MTEKLPISIDVCDDLIQRFSKITSLCNQLEAQFNFQTMTANWYGNEDNIVCINLSIATTKNFVLHKNRQSTSIIENHSDDVFSYYDKKKKSQLLICCIAITDSELSMLNQKPTLLAGLLHFKLQKVLNLFAKKFILTAI